MSTLSGIVSKGEKGKSKFQSLDINSLYRVSRGESLEQHQQKSTLPRKHGMQSLGKVPSARRPPANLPSLKSEHSNSDPAVSLVPSGGSGWATAKESTSATTNITANVTTTTPSDSPPTSSSPTQCVAATTPVSSLSHQPSLPGQQRNITQSPHPLDLGNKSSWSAIMTRPGDIGSPVVSAVVGYAGLVGGGRAGRGTFGLSFLAHQSPQFQHEFPSLIGQPPSVSIQSQIQQPSATVNAISVNAQHQSLLPQQPYSHNHSGNASGGPQQPHSQQSRELNAQYGPGPSLRPQTEGSWIQGGTRSTGGTGVGGAGNGNTQVVQGPPVVVGGLSGHTEGPAGGRSNLGQSPSMATVPAGQQNTTSPTSTGPSPTAGPNLHHYRGLIPPFMYRGNFPPGGFPSQIPSNMSSSGTRSRSTNMPERFSQNTRQPQERERQSLEEEVITRPIIKEEDLTQMDDISHDAGWATHDDIDYNQKLAFSDDETELEPIKREEKIESPLPREEKSSENSLDETDRLRDNHRESPRDMKENRENLSSAHRSWYPERINTGTRDYRGVNGPSMRDNYLPQQPSMRTAHSMRGVEEEEIWNQRRREQGEKVASAVERARQRKEEEEKRFQESTKQAAAKKLQDLEQKMKEKQAKNKDDEPLSTVTEPKGLINVPSVPIPVPEWEREREHRDREGRDRERSRTSSECKDDKPVSREPRDAIRDSRDNTNEFLLNRSSFNRVDNSRSDRERERDRDQRENRERDRDRDQRESREREQRDTRDRDQPVFSRQFQSNLPPRFQKQQAERSSATYNRVSPNADRTSSQPNVPFSQQYDLGRWSHGGHTNVLTGTNIKQVHSMPLPQRRPRTDSDITCSIDEDSRLTSRDHGIQRSSREDRFRPAIHHLFESRNKSGYHDEFSRGYKEDYTREQDDRQHSRELWERERTYDDKDRDMHVRSSRDIREFKDSRDFRDRDGRDSRDSRDRETRDIREKDYDSYVKSSTQQDIHDDRERERSESGDWNDSRRDERQDENRRETNTRNDDIRTERNERPPRPDSRDSRASRESKTSLRDDDSHRARDMTTSWGHDIADYEEKKRELYRDDHRERDRRQPPGPITREKLQAEELKSEKRTLTQLKRTNAEQDKKDIVMESLNETKKESDAWNRKSERTMENNRVTERNDNTQKAWADAVSPTFETDDDKMVSTKDEKNTNELKISMEKLSVEKREDLHIEEVKDDLKDDKREKNLRNRTNSGGSFRGRESRGGRSWGGAYNVYTRGWRGPEPRGRRGTGSRSMGRPGSAKSSSYGHTDSEISGDEVSGSTESGKEERKSAISPKPSVQKSDKDERIRDASRRDEKRTNTEFSQNRDKRGSFDGRPSREGFAPSGEPSRRGRGGFRTRGVTSGGRMEGYGPPPNKSPFSTERNLDDKSNIGQQGSPVPTMIDSDANTPSAVNESTDEKIIAKQALTASISGRRNKSPNIQQTNQSSVGKHDSGNVHVTHAVGLQRNQLKKDESKTKRTRSGSQRGRDNRDRSRVKTNVVKQNSTDIGNEEWETTSENSEDHNDDHKDSRHCHGRSVRSGQNVKQTMGGSNSQSRRHDQMSNNRDQREKSAKANVNSRAPGAEKRHAQNTAFNQRNHSGCLPVMQGTQSQNGRPRNQGCANIGSLTTKCSNKDSTVNRVDEIKLNDPSLIDQVIKEAGKKSLSRDKKSVAVDSELEANNYLTGGDDGGNSAEDKVDADGFQEVRSKKNLKDSRHGQREEPKPSRREKDKDRERDRSKTKLNGPQPSTQQSQNISLMSQTIVQPTSMLQKSFDRNPNRNKLAPRFQKQKLAKQQQHHISAEGNDGTKLGNTGTNYLKDSSSGPAPPPSINAWDKPFTSQLRSTSPNSGMSADIQLVAGLAGQNDHTHEVNEQANSAGSSHRNSPNGDKVIKNVEKPVVDKNVPDSASPPVQTLIFENTNYSKTTKAGPSDMAIKSKFSTHLKQQQRVEKRNDLEDDGNQMQQQQTLSVAFSNKPNELIKEKTQEPIQMPLSFNKSEDNADMRLDFTFESDLSQLTEDKNKSLSMTRSIHMTGAQSTISPSTAELNLKIASVKKVWENAPPMPTVAEHEDGNVISTANSFPQSFETGDDDGYSPHQQYSQNNMKNEITTSTNVCKLVPPQVKPQQQSGSGNAQTGSTVPGPSPIGPGQSPIGHPPASLQGPLSPPPFNSSGQPSHINYQEFPQYPGSQAAQYGSMSAIPSPPAVLFNTGSGQLPAQPGGLYGAFQLDQSRSPFTQYPQYAPSLQSSYNQQNVYLQQPPPPPHAQNAPTPDMYQSNLSQYRIPAGAAPPFGQNQQLNSNPNTVLISSSSNSLMSASVKPSTQPIGAIGTKAPHFQAQSAPQPNQLAYIPYDPNQVLGVSGSYMGNSQLVQRQGPSVQPSANSYYSATSADVFPGSQTGFYQPGGAGQQTGTHYGLQGFGQHNQSIATGNATPVGLQNFSSQFLSGSGLQIAAAAAAQQFRNPSGGLPGPANAAATFLSKHQQEQPRQLKSPSGNQQDVLASVFSPTPQIPSPKSRNCKQQQQSQLPQPSPTQHHKYQQYQGVSQSALVLQQNVRGMGMPPRAGIQPSQQRYPPPIQRPVVPFPPGPNPNNPSQQQNCMPSQQNQMNRHRPNLHQQQQRNMKLHQQYYTGQGQCRNGNVKMDANEKGDSHSDKIADVNVGGQTAGNKSNVTQQDNDNKEELNQQNE